MASKGSGLPYSAGFVAMFFALALLPSPGHCVSVMSVDFGSEWMKVAIVSPGVPMEIALNKESKRKTPIAIAFRDGERTFGDDALAIGVRFPQYCYQYLLELLGKKVDNPLVKQFQERFPYYNIVPDSVRGTVVFQHDADTQFSVEELVAMMLKKAQEIAQNAAGQAVNEAVITVPGFFNQAERKAMLQAAELAGIKVLQLMNDYTAVALNYGIFRRKDFNETAQYYMFYDTGASSTTATVVSYQIVKTKEKGYVETNPQLSILGVGYDRTLGGLEKQLRLRDFLGKKFNEMKKTKNDVFKNPRSLAKLFKEAGRLKNVLSANADHFAQVEGLIDEIDFKLQVTRDEFEKLSGDLFDRVKGPVEQALKLSGLSMDVISHVVLVGAGTRVPALQDRIAKAVGIELSKNLNTDEAAVFGAVYKAADLSAGFKVKKFITKDAVLFPIQVTFERELESGTKQMKRTLFGLMNPYPQKKILTFNKNLTDFEFNVGYGEVDYLSSEELAALGSLNITKVSLSGVLDAVNKHQGPNTESKGIKAHFQMDESGLLNLVNVEHVVEKTITGENEEEESAFSKLGSSISKLFTGPEETLKKENLDKSEEADEKRKETNDEKSSESNKTAPEAGEKEAKKEKEESKPKTVVLKEPVSSKEEFLFVPSLDDEQMKGSLAKLQQYDQKDELKRRHEGALNSLESMIFDVKNKLETDEYKSAATSSEADEINALCSKLGEWLDEEGFGSDANTLETKLAELKKATAKVWARVKEHRERPEALATLESMIKDSTNFYNTMKNVSGQNANKLETAVFTSVEIEALDKMIVGMKEWKEKSVAEQNQLSLSDDPKLTVKQITEKMATLDREIKYLVNKIKIWSAKVKEEQLKETIRNATKASDSNATADGAPPKEESKATEEEPKIIKPEASEEDASHPESTPEPAAEGEEEKPEAGERKDEQDDESKHSEL